MVVLADSAAQAAGAPPALNQHPAEQHTVEATVSAVLPNASQPSASEATEPLLVIEPPRGWQGIKPRELWAYRELLYFFAWRDIKVRYKQTALGAAWALIQPLTIMTIFTFVLGQAEGTATLQIPYSIFVFSGLMAWMLFATALASAANCLVESERLITKIAFPRLLMPAAAVGPALMDLGVTSVALAVLLLWHGTALAWTAPLALLPLGVIVIAVIGMGTLLAALNVMYRDFRYTTTFMLQAWMFATPAIYIPSFGSPSAAVTGVSTIARYFLLVNPLNGAISFFRAALFGWPLPWAMLGAAAIVSVAMLAAGLAYFRRTEDSFADII